MTEEIPSNEKIEELAESFLKHKGKVDERTHSVYRDGMGNIAKNTLTFLTDGDAESVQKIHGAKSPENTYAQKIKLADVANENNWRKDFSNLVEAFCKNTGAEKTYGERDLERKAGKEAQLMQMAGNRRQAKEIEQEKKKLEKKYSDLKKRFEEVTGTEAAEAEGGSESSYVDKLKFWK